MRASRLCQITSTLIVIVTTIAVTAQAKDRRETLSTWNRTNFGTRVTPNNRPDVTINLITERNGKLIGSCSIANLRSSTYQPAQLRIRGEWHAHRFWPLLEYQVGDQYKGPWRTIKKAPRSPSRTVLKVAPGQIIPELWVNLERFRSFIGKYAVGKIVLSSGDGAVFELQDLRGSPSTR